MEIPAPVLMSPAPVELPPLKRKKRRKVVTLGNLDTQDDFDLRNRIMEAGKLKDGAKFTAAWKKGKRRKVGKVQLQILYYGRHCTCCLGDEILIFRKSTGKPIKALYV